MVAAPARAASIAAVIPAMPPPMTSTSDSVHISPPRVMHVIAYASARVPAIRVARHVQKSARTVALRARAVRICDVDGGLGCARVHPTWTRRVQPVTRLGARPRGPATSASRGRSALRHPRRAVCGTSLLSRIASAAHRWKRISERMPPLDISGCAGFVAVARNAGAWDIVFSTYTPNEMGRARHEHQSL